MMNNEQMSPAQRDEIRKNVAKIERMEHAREVIKTTDGYKATAAHLVFSIEERYQWHIVEAHILQNAPTMIILALAETTHLETPSRFGLVAGHVNHIMLEEETYHKLAAESE